MIDATVSDVKVNVELVSDTSQQEAELTGSFEQNEAAEKEMQVGFLSSHRIFRFPNATLQNHSILAGAGDYCLVITAEGRQAMQIAREEGLGGKSYGLRGDVRIPGVLKRVSSEGYLKTTQISDKGGDNTVELRQDVKSKETIRAQGLVNTLHDLVSGKFNLLRRTATTSPEVIIKKPGLNDANDIEFNQRSISALDTLELLDVMRPAFVEQGFNLMKAYGATPQELFAEVVEGQNFFEFASELAASSETGLQVVNALSESLRQLELEVQKAVENYFVTYMYEPVPLDDRTDAVQYESFFDDKIMVVLFDLAPKQDSNNKLRNWILHKDFNKEEFNRVIQTGKINDAVSMLRSSITCVDPIMAKI
jgi:hypothetical protein